MRISDWSSDVCSSDLIQVAIMLDACHAQAGYSRSPDRSLPGYELLQGQVIALAGFRDRQQTTSDCGNDLCLAPHNPPLGIAWRQGFECQWLPERSDDHCRTDLLVLDRKSTRLNSS